MITINNPKFVAPVINALASFYEQAEAFHNSLIKQGVKAYRCNDGWVDRENHMITFFRSDRDKGWYWGRLDLQIGDLIYIGDASDSQGKFAKITGVIRKEYYSAKYNYKPINNGNQD